MLLLLLWCLYKKTNIDSTPGPKNQLYPGYFWQGETKTTCSPFFVNARTVETISNS